MYMYICIYLCEWWTIIFILVLRYHYRVQTMPVFLAVTDLQDETDETDSKGEKEKEAYRSNRLAWGARWHRSKRCGWGEGRPWSSWSFRQQRKEWQNRTARTSRHKRNEGGAGTERQQGRDTSTQLETMHLDEWGWQRHWRNTGACSLLCVEACMLVKTRLSVLHEYICLDSINHYTTRNSSFVVYYRSVGLRSTTTVPLCTWSIQELTGSSVPATVRVVPDGFSLSTVLSAALLPTSTW